MAKRNIICIILAIVLLLGAFAYHKIFVSSMEAQHEALISEYYQKKNEYDSITSQLKKDSEKAANSVTAVSNKKLEADEKAVEKYFNSAFTYSSEKEFSTNRSAMQEKLGDKFVKVCMPQVDFSKKSESNLFRKMSDAHLYPTKISGGTYLYDAVIEYTVYSDADDLENAARLNKNYALIKLSVDNNQKVSDVKAISLFEDITDISDLVVN